MAYQSFADWFNARSGQETGSTGISQLDSMLAPTLQQMGVQAPSADDPAVKQRLASELVGGINGMGIPAGMTADQILNYYKQQGGWEARPSPYDSGGLGGQLRELGGPVAWLGASAAGGPIAGTIAAANGSGATRALGIDPTLTTAAALAYGAYNGAPSATDGSSTTQGSIMQGPTGAGGGLGGGQVYYDDYGNPLTNENGSNFSPTPVTPGVGDAGAFDQFGSANSPNGTVPGNIGDNYTSPGVLDQIKGYASKLGMAPAALLQLIKGKVGAGGGPGGGPAGTDTLSQIIAALGPAALGVIGSGQQTAAFQRLADQYSSYGAPYRQRLSDLYSDPSSFLKSPEVTVPVQQASDIAAHSLSTGGNPIASGNSLQQLQDYSANQLFGRLGQEKDRLGGFGGLSTYNAAAPGAATSAVNSNAGAFNAAGAGIANIFNPPQTLAQQMAEFSRLSQAPTQ